ncbi:MAG: LTA synthase family protein [Endomicrobium sp.]|jgi:phosphoglycerol transferase MdoB-like AlkP superfamily enzyme|nr:LTA synthase family protein [Endomicrobium sp.]
MYYGKALSFEGLGFDIFKSFYMGVRYDLAVLAYLNIPITFCLVVLLFVGKETLFKKFIAFFKCYYTVFVGSLLILLCIDFGFYSYFQNHLNILIFGLFEDDTLALISTFAQNYNLFLIIGGFIILYVVIFIVSKYMLILKYKEDSDDKKYMVKILTVITAIFVNFIVARGSFGIFPLGMDNAEVSSNSFLNKVSINGVYTLQNAIELRQKDNNKFDYVSKAGYENNIRKAFADYLNVDIGKIPEKNPENSLSYTLPYNKTMEDLKPNVILIVMESFGSDLVKYNSEIFNVLGELKKHFDSDLVFYNFLPAHEGTIGSLEGIITNVVRLPSSIYLSQSEYAYKKYDFSGPTPYKNKGYETTFLYGGNVGWRNVGNFMPILGFDNVLGEGSMDKDWPRSQWGVYDEYLFEYLFRTLSQNDKQKFIYVMTTSNHPPYSMPDNYKSLPLNIPESLDKRVIGRSLADKRFITYQYSNEMLGRFITRIKKSKYADNTIIAVTGDHNFWNVIGYSNETTLDSFSVPFYLYIPDALKPKNVDTSVFGSHLDILPTLYNISISSSEYIAMGQNLLSEKAKDNIISIDVGFIMNKNCVVKYNFKNGESSFYKWNKNKSREICTSSETQEQKDLIKHYLSGLAISDYLI